MSFRSIIRFQVKPGEEPAFEAAFEKAGMLVFQGRLLGSLDHRELCEERLDHPAGL